MANARRRANPDLTPIQREALQRMADGARYGQVHALMNRSESTIRGQLNIAYAKLDAVSGPHAVAVALRRKLIS